MVEVSRDGKRVYLTNALYTPWDAQFYPDGIRGLDGEDRRGSDGRDRVRPRVPRRVRGRAASAPGAAAGRRRVAPTRSATRSDHARRVDLPGSSLLALGAAHGINPAMGWLFAVGRGLQERDRRAVWRALGPLAVGHALAIGVAIAARDRAGAACCRSRWLRWIVAAVAARGRRRWARAPPPRPARRHARRARASWRPGRSSWRRAHGAGLMVLPFVLGAAAPTAAAMHHHHAMSLNGTATAQPLAAGIARRRTASA